VITWRSAEPLKRRRTKIVATLGPASGDDATIQGLVAAGADVFRLDLATGDREDHARACEAVRAAAVAADAPVAVLTDLSGAEIRVGPFGRGGVVLAEGTPVTVTTEDVLGTPDTIPSTYPKLHEEVERGARIRFAHGEVELRVEAVDGSQIACRVVTGGQVHEGLAMHLPDSDLSAPPLTERGLADLRLALELGVDAVALSAVRGAADLEEVRALLPADDPPLLVAQIERPQALRDIEAVLDASDAVVVARAELAAELPPEDVPVLQQELVALARARGRPCIVAAEMLESMTANPLPTRAEVSDVSTAVFSEADAVMLSAETARGRHPVESVRMMDRIVRRIESHVFAKRRFRVDDADPLPGSAPLPEAVARATAQLSRDLGCRAIVVVGRSAQADGTVRVISAARPGAPVLAAVSSPRAMRQASLLWGVVPMLVPAAELADRRHVARRLTRRLGLAEFGERVLVVEADAGADDGDEAPRIEVISV
jgi:pyruvate kinase